MTSRIRRLLIAGAGLLCAAGPAHAQSELWVRVMDERQQAVRDVRLSYQGSQTVSLPTSDSGLTKLDLPASVRPATVLYLRLYAPPDMRIMLPINARVVVPASADPEEVRVCKKRTRCVYQSAEMLAGVAVRIIHGSLPSSVEVAIGAGNVSIVLRQAALTVEAKDLELSPGELDQEIRTRLQASDDPFIKAVGALYANSHAEASRRFAEFLNRPISDARRKHWLPADADFLIGQSHLEQGDFNSAAENFRKSMAAEPGNLKTHGAYGMSLYKARRFNESLEVWDQLQRLEPDDKFIHLNKGHTLNTMGRSLDAVQPFEQYIKLEPDGGAAGRAYRYIGNAYAAADKMDGALQSYHLSLERLRAVRDTAAQEQTFNDIRQLYARKPDLKVAHAYYAELLVSARQANDKRLEALVLGSLANVFAEQGDSQKALEAYAGALRLAEANRALSDTELVLLFKPYAALLEKNNRKTEALALEMRMQEIMGRSATPGMSPSTTTKVTPSGVKP